MTKATVLLLADSADSSSVFSEAGFTITVINDCNEALSRLADGSFDCFCLYSNSCSEMAPFVRQIGQLRDNLPLLVVSGRPSVHEAVIMTRAGAWEYAESPAEAVELIKQLVKGKDAPGAASHPAVGKAKGARGPGSAAIIGESPEMQKVFSLIEKVSVADTTVLVQGESGTGKELIAKALHFGGPRQTGPFVPVNCGAIPGELLESELFGHEKGAFTHAVRARLGRFELANGGTVFLDEIGEMSPMLQVKLLRVLQEKQFERVGGTKTISSDFRVIAATNRDLEEEVGQGRFREDLFYRLNVIQIEAPPLRDKPSDIPLLVDSFFAKFNRVKKRRVKGFTPEAMAALVKYAWPGNVRELENLVERMLILSSGELVALEELPERFLDPAKAAPAKSGASFAISEAGLCLSEVVTDFEKGIIEQALNRTGWVKNRAANLLQVNRTTLIEKMKRYNMVKPDNGLAS